MPLQFGGYEPMTIRQVYINGLERTKSDVVEHELQKAYQASDLAGVTEALHEASVQLHKVRGGPKGGPKASRTPGRVVRVAALACDLLARRA